MSFADSWNNAQAGNDTVTEYAPLPEGTYACRLLEVDSELNPNDQVMRTTLTFEIQGDDHQGRRIWEKVKRDDNLMWKAVKLFNGMGLQGSVNSWYEWTDMMKSKVGAGFEVDTSNRTHNDKTYTGVKDIRIDAPVPF